MTNSRPVSLTVFLRYLRRLCTIDQAIICSNILVTEIFRKGISTDCAALTDGVFKSVNQKMYVGEFCMF
jgi:hypothetical protein